jgi:metal-responsive CopG/Arc/MetJ family transcriptional regulator
MAATHNETDRVTISLPHSLALDVESLRSDLKISRSELFKVAVERFIADQRRASLQAVVAEMAEEYRSNAELTSLTALDGEDFI